jgi:FtsH-binding integral membrane protein
MSNAPNPFGSYQSDTLPYQSRSDSVSVAQFFNTAYAWMATGLALTAAVAWLVQPYVRTIFQPGTLLILVLAELALVWFLASSIQRLNATVATALFLVYSALNGLTLSSIFIVYSLPSIAGTFIATAGMFAAVSVYGFMTKRDLSSMGSMLFMALIGLLIASVVNFFLANEMLYWLITYAGVLIFVGLTAYDTQKLRWYAIQTQNDPTMSARLAIYGALTLYLDFINLFLFLLRILGNRR